MKQRHLLSILALLACGASLAAAEPPGGGFTGTYIATLPERAEILNLHGDGTAEITLSDQVTAGAGSTPPGWIRSLRARRPTSSSIART